MPSKTRKAKATQALPPLSGAWQRAGTGQHLCCRHGRIAATEGNYNMLFSTVAARHNSSRCFP